MFVTKVDRKVNYGVQIKNQDEKGVGDTRRISFEIEFFGDYTYFSAYQKNQSKIPTTRIEEENLALGLLPILDQIDEDTYFLNFENFVIAYGRGASNIIIEKSWDFTPENIQEACRQINYTACDLPQKYLRVLDLFYKVNQFL
jgi:hypothetical protein